MLRIRRHPHQPHEVTGPAGCGAHGTHGAHERRVKKSHPAAGDEFLVFEFELARTDHLPAVGAMTVENGSPAVSRQGRQRVLATGQDDEGREKEDHSGQLEKHSWHVGLGLRFIVGAQFKESKQSVNSPPLPPSALRRRGQPPGCLAAARSGILLGGARFREDAEFTLHNTEGRSGRDRRR